MYVPELLLHVSRGVRWDSDHVVTYTDELQAIMQEIVRGDYLDRVHIGLDFFDASINRVAAWAIGTRNALKAVLGGVAGTDRNSCNNLNEKVTSPRGWRCMEEQKTMPLGAVWDHYCQSAGVPVGAEWLGGVRRLRVSVLSQRANESAAVGYGSAIAPPLALQDSDLGRHVNE